MATEDHDLAEVDHCYVVDPDSQPRLIRYEAGASDQGRAVGNVVFSEAVQAVVAELMSALPDSEFTREFRPVLERAYRAGKSFALAFAEVFSYLFSNYGLILLDPESEELKALAQPAFERILMNSENYQSLILLRSQQLNHSGYHTQVVLDEETTGLFFEDDGKRRALVRENGLCRIKGADALRPTEEWRAQIRATPWKFSPNVLFRPVVQDFLLPTLTYVGGPSEVAYLAQVGPLYRELDLKAPIIFPRFSYTIVEKKIAKILEKYHLKFPDVFLGSEALIKKIVEENLDQKLAGRFDDIESKLASLLGELEGPLRAVDQTLGEALKTTHQKVQYQIGHLRTKFVHAEARQQEVLTKQIEKVLAILYPLKTLQERRINIFYFLSRYGMDFLAQLYEEIDLTDPQHRLCFVA
jgi:bacillithiol biosynthesis cysteine-adding enzyme BshC